MSGGREIAQQRWTLMELNGKTKSSAPGSVAPEHSLNTEWQISSIFLVGEGRWRADASGLSNGGPVRGTVLPHARLCAARALGSDHLSGYNFVKSRLSWTSNNDHVYNQYICWKERGTAYALWHIFMPWSKRQLLKSQWREDIANSIPDSLDLWKWSRLSLLSLQKPCWKLGELVEKEKETTSSKTMIIVPEIMLPE